MLCKHKGKEEGCRNIRWNTIYSKESDKGQSVTLHNDKKQSYQDGMQPLHRPVPGRMSLSSAHKMENTPRRSMFLVTENKPTNLEGHIL